MKTWEIIVLVLILAPVIYFTILKINFIDQNKLNFPLFSSKQIHEFLDQRGPVTISDALEIFKGGYNYSWNNVLKAALILGDATVPDQKEAVNQLISNLYSSEPKLVAVSAVSLGKLKDPKALPVLEKLIYIQPSKSEVEKEKSLKFERLQREDYAKRIGATLSNYPNIPSADEQYSNVRKSAVWALNEIRGNVERIKSNEPLDVSDAFIVINNQIIFDSGKIYQALLALSHAEGNDTLRAMQLFLSNLTHPDPMVVNLSVLGLGQVGDSSALNELKNLLDYTTFENGMLRDFLNDSIEKISSRIKPAK